MWAVAFDLQEEAAFDYLWENPERIRTPVSNPAALTAAFQKVSRYFVGRYGEKSLLLKAAILELLSVAHGEFVKNDEDEILPGAVEEALDWMTANLHDPDITLQDVAAAGGLSIHHFGRVFRRAMGQGAMSYLRDLRVRQSYGLLQGTALRVNEIAYEVGFRDALHYSRVFRIATGKSPTEFREESISGKV